MELCGNACDGFKVLRMDDAGCGKAGDYIYTAPPNFAPNGQGRQNAELYSPEGSMPIVPSGECTEAQDAESCCGDSGHEMRGRLAELADEELCMHFAASADQVASQQQLGSRQQQQQQQQQQYRIGWHEKAADAAYSSGGSSTGTVRMGDDFECMASEDVSMLLEDSAEYPGGVEAALADWAEACSQDQAASASLGPAAVDHSNSMGPRRRPLPPVFHIHHHHPATHGTTIPSLAALLVTPTPPPCYAANMLPCCQWGAFEGDAVGDVLAGKVPVPVDSCCSSGGLTDCLMGRWG